MSDGLVPDVKVACEGPTDYYVIKAVLGRVLPNGFTSAMIQPESSDFAGGAFAGTDGGWGDTGGGWKGVRKWCQERFADFPMANTSVLVVHVDADAAEDDEIDCQRPCPPASDTADALAAVVLNWMGLGTPPDRVVLCIPSRSTEAWVVAAMAIPMGAAQPDLECRRHPEALLVGRPPRFVRRRGRGYKKETAVYRRHVDRLAAAWPLVQDLCPQMAQRFEANLREALDAFLDGTEAS